MEEPGRLDQLKLKLTGYQFNVVQAVYQEDVMLFVDLGAMDSDLSFEYNNMGGNVLDLAVSRGR